jgi:hypothetical protein
MPVAELSAAKNGVLSYHDESWSLIHHSRSRGQLVLGLKAYFDDSGSDHRSSVAAIGGPVMSRILFREFGKEWPTMLGAYRIPEPLHMVDFVRPYGKHIGMGHEMKLALFHDVAKIINRHKVYSLSVTISQDDFLDLLGSEVRRNVIGPYAMAFLYAVVMIRGVWQANKRRFSTGYLIDDGSAHKDQLLAAHSEVMRRERETRSFRYTAAMAFDTDDRVPALQAADVIAWSARRRETTGTLSGEFEPLNELFSKDHPPHAHLRIPRDEIESFAAPINDWISRNGSLPSLAEIVR